MKTITYNVPNISCGHCVHTIKMELRELKGIHSVDADAEKKTVTITYKEPTSLESIESLLAEINYPVEK